MSKQKIQQTVEWAIEMARGGKPIISDQIVPTLKEKGMQVLKEKLAKRGIQVWWSQTSPSDKSIILPKNIQPEVIVRDGFKVGMVQWLGENQEPGKVMMLPAMRA